MTETLTERDLRFLAAVIEEGRHDEPTDGVPWATLTELARLIHCDNVTFCEVRGQRHRIQIEQSIEQEERYLDRREGDPLEPATYWQNVPDFLPYTYADRTSDVTSAIRWSDFYTATELRNTSLIAEHFDTDGCKHSIGIVLSKSPGHHRRINLFRDTGADFTERDRLALYLLRPHLFEVYLEAQRRREQVPRLSPREWEVLRLADEGRSNADIARTLFISVATVRKHLEHIFDRTGVRTRAAAAALMMPHLNTAWTDRGQADSE